MGVIATPTSLAAASSTTDGTSFATAALSAAPKPYQLILIWYIVSGTAGTTNVPTASGGGLTSITHIGSATNGTNTVRLGCFVAQQAAAGATTAITFSFGAVTQTGMAWQVQAVDGAFFDAVNNGLDALRQITPTNLGGVTQLTASLTSFLRPDSATFGAFGHNTNEVHTPLNSMVELQDSPTTGYATPAWAMETQWNAGNISTPGASWTTSGTSVGLAFEVLASQETPQYRAGSFLASTWAGASTVTPTLPTGWQAGDYVVIFIGQQAGTITTPAGWTLISTPITASSPMGYWFGRKMRSGDVASAFTISTSTSGRWFSAAFIGANQVNVAGSQQNAVGTSVTAPAQTPLVRRSLLLGVFESGGNTAPTIPTSMTQIGTAGGSVPSMTAAWEVGPNAGVSTGNRVGTLGAGAGNAGWLLAFESERPHDPLIPLAGVRREPIRRASTW